MIKLEHAPVVVKKRRLTSRSKSYIPCSMEGWIGGRSLSFCDVCREIWGSTAANGATDALHQLMSARAGASSHSRHACTTIFLWMFPDPG